MLLIGSVAARLQDINLGRAVGRDIDVIIDPKELLTILQKLKDNTRWCRPLDKNHMALGLNTGYILEMELAWPGSTGEELLQEAAKLPLRNEELMGIGVVQVAPAGMLLALKLSHRYKKNSPHFLKTMRDIQALRLWHANNGGMMEVPSWGGFIARREAETYKNILPNLKRTKKEFFRGDSVPYKYDHDTLHLAVAHHEAPAYKLFSVDGQEVLSSREKFAGLPYLDKLYAVLEETYVLALERSQIPFEFKPDPKLSFDIAHEKVCTSITGGWFREFAWENFDNVQTMYSVEYIQRFKDALAAGIVKEYANGPDAYA